MDYEREDKIALERALLGLRVCPRCRADLQPVRLFDTVWGCKAAHSLETWYLPTLEAETRETRERAEEERRADAGGGSGAGGIFGWLLQVRA